MKTPLGKADHQGKVCLKDADSSLSQLHTQPQSTTPFLPFWFCPHLLPSKRHTLSLLSFMQSKLIPVSGPRMWISCIFHLAVSLPSKSQAKYHNLRENFSGFNSHWI